MPGHVILSHGSDSGPDATKVAALARVAESLGWTTSRPDYRDDDRLGYAAAAPARVERLVAEMRAAPTPVVLAGSSMGAFVSGLASLRAACAGLFLVALPIDIPGCPRFDAVIGVPAFIAHGWHDELCPAAATLTFARERSLPTLLLDDDHRLANHVDALARQFRLFLHSIDP